MSANINLPRILRVGAGASGELAATLDELSVCKPLLVTDPFMNECGYVARLLQQLDEAGVSHGLFDQCIPDPTTDSVAAALAVFRSGAHDSVVALGGGSSIDTAKAVAVMAEREGPMRQYKVPHTITSGAPIIAIPTTAGTGSEATRVAVISDTETQEKMLWMGLGLMPVAALVDFELTLSMPYRLTADTGIDSLCHALEAYVSRKANPFTDSVALTAMRTIALNIRTACEVPDNRAAREAMMLAATQGGIAFANASVTLIHGMSRPIGHAIPPWYHHFVVRPSSPQASGKLNRTNFAASMRPSVSGGSSWKQRILIVSPGIMMGNFRPEYPMDDERFRPVSLKTTKNPKPCSSVSSDARRRMYLSTVSSRVAEFARNVTENVSSVMRNSLYPAPCFSLRYGVAHAPTRSAPVEANATSNEACRMLWFSRRITASGQHRKYTCAPSRPQGGRPS